MNDRIAMALYRVECGNSAADDAQTLREYIEQMEANFAEERARYLVLQKALKAACGSPRSTPPDRPGLWFEIDGDTVIVVKVKARNDTIYVYDGSGHGWEDRGVYRQVKADSIRWQGPIAPLPDVTPF